MSFEDDKVYEQLSLSFLQRLANQKNIPIEVLMSPDHILRPAMLLEMCITNQFNEVTDVFGLFLWRKDEEREIDMLDIPGGKLKDPNNIANSYALYKTAISEFEQETGINNFFLKEMSLVDIPVSHVQLEGPQFTIEDKGRIITSFPFIRRAQGRFLPQVHTRQYSYADRREDKQGKLEHIWGDWIHLNIFYSTLLQDKRRVEKLLEDGSITLYYGRDNMHKLFFTEDRLKTVGGETQINLSPVTRNILSGYVQRIQSPNWRRPFGPI